MQFGFIPEYKITNEILILGQLQGDNLQKKKKMYFALVDMEKALS